MRFDCNASRHNKQYKSSFFFIKKKSVIYKIIYNDLHFKIKHLSILS